MTISFPQTGAITVRRLHCVTSIETTVTSVPAEVGTQGALYVYSGTNLLNMTVSQKSNSEQASACQSNCPLVVDSSQPIGIRETGSYCFHSLNQSETWELRTWSPFVLGVKRAAIVDARQEILHVSKAVGCDVIVFGANCPIMLAQKPSLYSMACRILLTYVSNHIVLCSILTSIMPESPVWFSWNF